MPLRSLGGPDILVLVSARPPNPLRETLKEDEQSRWDQAYRAQLWSIIDLVAMRAIEFHDDSRTASRFDALMTRHGFTVLDTLPHTVIAVRTGGAES